MKQSHIIGLVVIGIAIAVIVSMTGSTSTYVTFGEAKRMAEKGDQSKIHVVGRLVKNNNGEIVGMEYSPQTDPNYFAFSMADTNHVAMKVIYNNPKPADFERSEQIVIIGAVEGTYFKADKILMKCPSKYNETEIQTTL